MVHFFSTDIRNRCRAADDCRSTGSHDPHRVTCPTCLAAIRTFQLATDETQKSAPAVVRRAPVTA